MKNTKSSQDPLYTGSLARYGASMQAMDVSPFDSRLDPSWKVPSDEECSAYWDRFRMPDHIREHSLQVADIATALAAHASEIGRDVNVQAVRASALLHDLAKIYTIENGGSHAQIGAAWAVRLTGNPVIAQGILHHVYWPFDLDPWRYFPPLAVLYADKRVMHSHVVSVGKRFTDLLERYGRNEETRDKIRDNLRQALAVQENLGQYLKVDLNACTFDSGRLVG